MSQLSLFPDGFELQEQALAALRDLHVDRAIALVRRARLGGAPLVGLDGLERALSWLRSHVKGPPDNEVAARLLRELPSAVANGLDATAAALVELGVAGFLVPRLPPATSFLDAGQTVPVSRVLLLRGDAQAARDAAAALLGAGNSDHAGLWFDHADACWLLQRRDEANASYARALVLGPHDGHAYRCRHDALRSLWQRFATAGGSTGLLLAEAWIAGVLSIPSGNSWLSPAQRDRVRERSTADPGWEFSRLLYLDRSARAGECDVALRERMTELLSDVFARFVAAVARRQG